MVEKKKVRFANTAGKPLVTIREIDRAGKSHKIRHEPRKFVPADLKRLKAKHEIAEKRAIASLSRAEDNLNKAKKLAANIRKTHQGKDQQNEHLHEKSGPTPGKQENYRERREE